MPARGLGYIFTTALVSQADTKLFQSNPTLAIGDVKVKTDNGSYANIGTLPTASGKDVTVTLSAAEMDGEDVLVKFVDAAGAEWCDSLKRVKTSIVERGVYIITSAGVYTAYSTPDLAQTAAATGDNVYVRGSWTVTGTFGTSGVRYHFAPGAKLTKATGDIWTCAAQASYQVDGEGEFVASNGTCINLTRPTLVRIKGRRASAAGSSNPCIKIDGSNSGASTTSEAHFEFQDTSSSLYDGIWLTGDVAGVVVRCSLVTDTLRVGQNPMEFGLESPSQTPTIHFYLKANNIVSQAGSVVCNAQQAIGSCTIDAGQIWNLTNDDFGEEGLLYSTVSGFNLTVRCPQIKCRIRTRATGKLRIVGARIESTDWTGDSGTSGAGTIYVADDGLELENCELLSNSASNYSIQGVSGKTIKIVGALIQNKVTHANVTLSYQQNGTTSGGTGTGQYPINHSGGTGLAGADVSIYAPYTAGSSVGSSSDVMRFTSDGSTGVSGLTIRAYLASDYDANVRTALATTYTGSDGRWASSLNLNSGTFYLIIDTPGDSYTSNQIKLQVP